MIDSVVGQGALQRLGDVVLANDIGEGVGAIAPVERERRARGRAGVGIVEQGLILSVLDALPLVLGEPRVLEPCFLHACTLCPDGDRQDLVSADAGNWSFGRRDGKRPLERRFARSFRRL